MSDGLEAERLRETASELRELRSKILGAGQGRDAHGLVAPIRSALARAGAAYLALLRSGAIEAPAEPGPCLRLALAPAETRPTIREIVPTVQPSMTFATILGPNGPEARKFDEAVSSIAVVVAEFERDDFDVHSDPDCGRFVERHIFLEALRDGFPNRSGPGKSVPALTTLRFVTANGEHFVWATDLFHRTSASTRIHVMTEIAGDAARALDWLAAKLDADAAERRSGGDSTAAGPASTRHSDRPDAPRATPPIDFVTLDQIAAMVKKNKRTLERYKGRMPEPAAKGGGGRPTQWSWTQVRPWLQETFAVLLPEIHPSHAGRPT